MIILHDRNVPRSRFLMPMLRKEWMPSSISLKRDQLGNEVERTCYTITAKSNDGVAIWVGVFDDREDFDAFLQAIALGTLKQERALWDLPTPSWQPYLGELLTYEFASTTYLTAAGATYTWYLKGDWNRDNNSIEVIGGGGGGGFAAVGGGGTWAQGTGGGGGAYSKVTNVILTPGNISYYIAPGAAYQTVTGNFTNGYSGGDTWFNGTSISSATCSAQGGGGGTSNYLTGTYPGGTGGQATSGIGSVKYNGGRGGNAAGATTASGAGGAGGPNGAGNQGVDRGFTGSSNGGSGGAGSGGAGGIAGSTYIGGNGTEMGGGYGSGGGGSGIAGAPGGNTFGAQGGNYGGGGGGVAIASYTGNFTGGSRSSVGIQGLIKITYEPIAIAGFNSPMLGM